MASTMEDSPLISETDTRSFIETTRFRKDYDALLKEVLEDSSEDEEDVLNNIDIDMDAATAELPEDLRIALEDRSLADKYLANLKTFMSHRKSQSVNSLTGKGDYSLPNSPAQATFPSIQNKPFLAIDPLYKALNAIPYNTRLISGVPSLNSLQQKFNKLVIPELELPVMPESDIQIKLKELYKLRDDLSIHFSGGLLTNNTIEENKKQNIVYFLDHVSKEIALYEEFVKKDNYLNLENILNEVDSTKDKNSAEYVENTELYPLQLSPSISPSEQLQQESFNISDCDLNEIKSEPREVFQWTPFVKLSDQLYSNDVKQESGLISVMSVSGLIAIGTTRSLVFIYDYSQNLECILGDSNKALEIGAATTLAFSSDCTTIVCGYSEGYIILWNIKKPHYPLRIIAPISKDQIQKKGGHIRGASILHIEFVGNQRSEFVSADDRGMVFYHIAYKMMMIPKTHSIWLFGRYRIKRPSTIFSMQLLPPSKISHPAENFGLIALLTPYEMIIIALNPMPQAIFRFDKLEFFEMNKDKHTISESISGCLSWLPVTKTESSDKKDPMFAFSWGNHVFIYAVKVHQDETQRGTRLSFKQLGSREISQPIVSIQWISRQILAFFTPNEEMLLFDRKTMKEAISTSIREKKLIYHDWFGDPLKDLVTIASCVAEGPSEETIPLAVEMSYSGSIKSYKGKIFLLCLDKIYVGNLLSWKDRVYAFLKVGNIDECIILATSFYNGTDIQTVIGLPENEDSRKTLVGKEIMKILKSSLDFAFPAECTFDIEFRRPDSLRRFAHASIEACLSMSNDTFIFYIYERFSDNTMAWIFLEVLEPFIVNDRISDIPPLVMKELVNHYHKNGLLKELEQVIWHVNPCCLDIDQVVSMCNSEGMHEAMMYTWNKSMHDYVSPLVEMLKIIRVLLQNNTNEDQEWQNAEKVFEYLEAILSGRPYPEESSAASLYEIGDARGAVYSFVFSGRCVTWPPVGGSLVMTIDDDEGVLEPTYPYLRLLLRFNTSKFLKTLETAFEDPWLNGGEDILSSKFDEEVPGKVISRQIIVNTLLDVFEGDFICENPLPPKIKESISASTVQSTATSNRKITLPLDVFQKTANVNTYYYDNMIIFLYMFIASNLHKYTTFILLPLKTLNKMLIRISEDKNLDKCREKEIAVLNLLKIYTPTNQEHMVELYEEAGFWRVLEKVYHQDKKFGKLIGAYLKNEDGRDKVFDCIHELLTNEQDKTQKEEIMQVFMIRISQFVDIDGQRTAEVVEMFGNEDHEDAIRRLEEDQEFDDDESCATSDKRIFSYLRGLLEPFSDGEVPDVNRTVQERYIELMCRFDPSNVYNYFNTKFKNNIPLDNIRETCEKYGRMDATVWIMEKTGKTHEALDKILNIGEERKDCIIKLLENHQKSSIWKFEEINALNIYLIGLNGILRVSTQLCENKCKYSCFTPDSDKSITNEEYLSQPTENQDGQSEDQVENQIVDKVDQIEPLWLKLLDTYISFSIEINNALKNIASSEIHQRMEYSFKINMHSILHCIHFSESTQVSFSQVLLHLIDKRSKNETKFYELKDILFDVIETYDHKEKLADMTDSLFDYDTFTSLKELANNNMGGWKLKKLICNSCNESVLDILPKQQTPIIKKYKLLNCGHYFHFECLKNTSPELCDVCQKSETEIPESIVKMENRKSNF